MWKCTSVYVIIRLYVIRNWRIVLVPIIVLSICKYYSEREKTIIEVKKRIHILINLRNTLPMNAICGAATSYATYSN